ncbi:uncharacterized protein LOC141904349 [Tubulanus polymorphus]|uniref:uncharacterized protein LOC141904349 n=1 Tax=Tubulanus polymorphus TaxID=672921 RepID=UPI003DA3735E
MIFRLVLRSDGTEIDNDYFDAVPDDSILMLLTEQEEWYDQSPPESNQGASATMNTTPSVTEQRLITLMEKMKRKSSGGDLSDMVRILLLKPSFYTVFEAH